MIAQTGQAGQPVIMGQVVQAAGQAAPLLIQQPQVGLLEEYSCILHLNLELKHTVRRLGNRHSSCCFDNYYIISSDIYNVNIRFIIVN